MEKSKIKKETYRDRFLDNLKNKYGARSNFYYFSLLLVSICSLVVAWLLLANNGKTAKFSDFFSLYGFQEFSVVILLFVVITLLITLISYLKIYSKGNKSKFYAVYSSITHSQFFNKVSLYGMAGDVTLFGKMADRKIKDNLACDITYSKKFFEKVAFAIFGGVALIWSLFIMDRINIWLYFVMLMAVTIDLSFIIIVLLTRKNKTRGIAIISKVCKMLYDMKIVKDYEKAFNKMVDKLLIYANSFNYSKALIWVELASNLLIFFLKFLVVYLTMVNLVLADSSLLGEVIIKCYLLESVFMLYPLPRGILIYEILFVYLFSSIIPNGFVFFVLMIYRIFDIVLPFINYSIVGLIDLFVYKNNKKLNNENIS